MMAIEILNDIVSLNTGEKIDLFDGISILSVGYTGLVARNGWDKRWKLKKHKDRSKLGLFDFRALLNGKPPSHRELLNQTIDSLDAEDVFDIYEGGNPESYKSLKSKVLQLIQLLFLEQEVNYGSNVFQAWTKMKAPRDFFMAYILRALDMSHEESLRFITLSTDRYGVIRRPPDKNIPEWKNYMNQLSSDIWLSGEVLTKFQEKADEKPNNPHYPDS